MKKDEVMSIFEYKQWLRNNLYKYGIGKRQLISKIMEVEKAVSNELKTMGSVRRKPFYRLFDKRGDETKTWLYAAELTLFLRYNNYDLKSYIKATLKNPLNHNRVRNKGKKDQLPLNCLFPVTRLNTLRMRKYTSHYKNWIIKND